MSNREAIHEFFTEGADDYSSLFTSQKTGANHGFRERLALANDLTSKTNGALLDCACGSGEITASLLATGRYDTAEIVDLSSRMLKLAGGNITSATSGLDFIPEIHYTNSDIFGHLEMLRERRFDLILCLGLIAHTGKLDVLLSKLRPLLNPQGAILLQSTVLNRAFSRITRAATAKRYLRNHGYSITYYTEDNIRDTAASAGLTISSQENFSLGLPFGDRICPPLNYFLESKCQNWSKRHGTEALFLLEPADSASFPNLS